MPTLKIVWHEQTSDFGQPMPWFGSWLVGDGETEGDWFHSGRGAAETSHEPPEDAVGVRLRFWPSEGLDPEYIDLPLPDSGTNRDDRPRLRPSRPALPPRPLPTV